MRPLGDTLAIRDAMLLYDSPFAARSAPPLVGSATHAVRASPCRLRGSVRLIVAPDDSATPHCLTGKVTQGELLPHQ